MNDIKSAREDTGKFLTTLTEKYPDAHVQVLFTIKDNGITESFALGIGNWYARHGICHHFLNSDIADDAAAKIADALKNE